MSVKVRIKKKLDESKKPTGVVDDSYATETRKARRKSTKDTKGTDEFFTPDRLCNYMLDRLDPEVWTNFDRLILEPSAGNGSFVLCALRRRLANCSNESDVEKTLSTIYSVELMADNVKEQKQRVENLIRESGYEVTDKMKKIMRNNMVCSSFFDWDFENWRPADDGKSIALF